MKVVVNRCFGGFGLSDKAYEWLIAHGIPVKKYKKEVRGADGRFKREPENDGKVIFDRSLDEDTKENFMSVGKEKYIKMRGRYWEVFIWRDERSWPLLVQCVEELGKESWGRCAKLEVVEIPDGIEWEIDEYDGTERIAEVHRSW